MTHSEAFLQELRNQKAALIVVGAKPMKGLRAGDPRQAAYQDILGLLKKATGLRRFEASLEKKRLKDFRRLVTKLRVPGKKK